MREKIIHIMKAPSGAFTDSQIKQIKKDFKVQGVDLIVAIYNNQSSRTPEFERVHVLFEEKGK